MKLICEFSNGTTRTVTPTAKLKLQQNYSVTHGTARKQYYRILESTNGHPISAHTSDVHTELMVTIPSSAPPSISNCSILVVEYIIEVGTYESLCLRSSLTAAGNKFRSNHCFFQFHISLCSFLVSPAGEPQ